MDNLSKEGAIALAERLTKYWHGQGYVHFRAEVVLIGRPDGRHAYAVVSNLISGTPPTRPTPIAPERIAA